MVLFVSLANQGRGAASKLVFSEFHQILHLAEINCAQPNAVSIYGSSANFCLACHRFRSLAISLLI